MVFDDTFSTMEHMRKGKIPGNSKNLVEEHSDIATEEKFTLAKEWHLNKYSSMTLPRESWKENSLEPGTQDLPPGSNPKVAPSCMTKEPAPAQGIYTRPDTLRPSNGEGSHHLEQSHHMSHSNSAQNPTEVNLDSSTLDLPSGEDHNVPYQSSRLIPEYVNLLT